MEDTDLRITNRKLIGDEHVAYDCHRATKMTMGLLTDT